MFTVDNIKESGFCKYFCLIVYYLVPKEACATYKHVFNNPRVGAAHHLYLKYYVSKMWGQLWFVGS